MPLVSLTWDRRFCDDKQTSIIPLEYQTTSFIDHPDTVNNHDATFDEVRVKAFRRPNIAHIVKLIAEFLCQSQRNESVACLVIAWPA
jgi:hypothetical protein